MAFMNYRTLLSFVFLFVFPWCVQAYPSALYLLDDNDKIIVIWADRQVSVPLAQAHDAISIIFDFLFGIPEDSKIIVRNISLDYDQRCLTMIGKHEHEATYAYQSLVLDTIASRLKSLPQKTLLVQGSSADVMSEITSACLSSQEKYIVLFVDAPIAASIAEQLRVLGFTQELTTS